MDDPSYTNIGCDNTNTDNMCNKIMTELKSDMVLVLLVSFPITNNMALKKSKLNEIPEKNKDSGV